MTPHLQGLIFSLFYPAPAKKAGVHTDDAIPVEPGVEEQRLHEQVESTPLCAAVLAAFTGAVGRRWTLGELQRKLAALGFNASRVRLTTALVQLEAHLFDNAFLPWMLIE